MATDETEVAKVDRSPELTPAQRRRVLSRKIASVVIIGVFALALWKSQEFTGLGKWFPELAAGIGLGVAIVHAALVLLDKDLGKAVFDTGNEDLEFNEGLEKLDIPQTWILLALAAFPLLVVIAGFIPAVVIWMPLFFKYIAGQRWWVAIAETGGSVAALYVLHLYIGMVFPLSWFVS